ncbi:hypothetical protein [Pseudomonas viridiflava]|uniref:hypothetical protein n=1 Tax=Pseudomonas viridiflava TaxID=33069 RepID=UPI000F03BFE2|nr:hypothetical protein [Pseudomonas viridiflava]
MSTENIADLCLGVLKDLGFGDESVSSLVERWQEFVDECRSGYAWDYSEYKNEIMVRGLLQCLLDHPEICKAGEVKWIFEEVLRLDDEFKSLLQPGVSLSRGEGWWDTGVLIYGGEEYCQYMKNAHGISARQV